MPPAKSRDRNAVVRRVNATLRGPVLDALGELLPEVRRLSRRTAVEDILDDIELLDRCFAAFRSNTDRFRHILVNRHRMAVDDADALLECGRSLDQVVAMVVRTAAKRHFRRRLDGAVKPLRGVPARRAPRRDLMARLRALLLGSPPVMAASRPKSRAEVLYEAFHDYLLHDWQVPMIPEYCLLTPGLVRRLGVRILDYRLAEDIRRLRADPDNPPPPTPVVQPPPARGRPPAAITGAGAQPAGDVPPIPAFLTGAAGPKVAEQRVSDGMARLDYGEPERSLVRDERARLDEILSTDGKRLKSGAFTIALLDPAVRAALPDAEQTVRITGILGTVNGLAGKMLVGELGLRVDQLAVFLMTAHGALGPNRFETAFGVPGRPEYVGRIIERAKMFKIGQTTPLPEIAAFVVRCFKADKKPSA